MPFETIEIDLSYDDRMLLIRSYVRQNMLPESIEAFEHSLEESDNVRQALYVAVINDATVRALMNRIRIEEQQEEQDVTEK